MPGLLELWVLLTQILATLTVSVKFSRPAAFFHLNTIQTGKHPKEQPWGIIVIIIFTTPELLLPWQHGFFSSFFNMHSTWVWHDRLPRGPVLNIMSRKSSSQPISCGTNRDVGNNLKLQCVNWTKEKWGVGGLMFSGIMVCEINNKLTVFTPSPCSYAIKTDPW